MTTENQEESIAQAINGLTQKVSAVLLEEFLNLDESLQFNVVLIKAAQLMLANILCQVAANTEELDQLAAMQDDELKGLIHYCIHTAFSNKFECHQH